MAVSHAGGCVPRGPGCDVCPGRAVLDNVFPVLSTDLLVPSMFTRCCLYALPVACCTIQRSLMRVAIFDPPAVCAAISAAMK